MGAFVLIWRLGFGVLGDGGCALGVEWSFGDTGIGVCVPVVLEIRDVEATPPRSIWLAQADSVLLSMQSIEAQM